MWVSTKQSERCASSTVHNTTGVHTAIRTPTDLTLVPQFLSALSVVTQCTQVTYYDHTSLTNSPVHTKQWNVGSPLISYDVTAGVHFCTIFS